jgi:hypothetical protein
LGPHNEERNEPVEVFQPDSLLLVDKVLSYGHIVAEGIAKKEGDRTALSLDRLLA